jgi:hypothetical protein
MAKVTLNPAIIAIHGPAFAVSIADFLNAPAVDEINLAAYAGQIGDNELSEP